MEMINATGKIFATVLVMICLSKANDNLTWKVMKKVMGYGEDLSLSCQVDNCCQKSAGWGKWTPKNELITIFIDVKNLNVDNRSKYDGAVVKTGFSLVIRNITRDDLNMTHSCTYGFLVSEKKMLLTTDAFLENCPDASTKHGKSGTIQHVLPLSLVPVAVICIVAVIIFVYRKKKSRKPQDNLERPANVHTADNSVCLLIPSVNSSPSTIAIGSNCSPAQHEQLNKPVPTILVASSVSFKSSDIPNKGSKDNLFVQLTTEESQGDRVGFNNDLSSTLRSSYQSCKSTLSDKSTT